MADVKVLKCDKCGYEVRLHRGARAHYCPDEKCDGELIPTTQARPFTKFDWEGFAGCERWPNGDEPVIREFPDDTVVVACGGSTGAYYTDGRAFMRDPGFPTQAEAMAFLTDCPTTSTRLNTALFRSDRETRPSRRVFHFHVLYTGARTMLSKRDLKEIKRRKELARMVRQCWEYIKYDYAQIEGADIDSLGAVELTEIAGDYIGMYAGTKADLKELAAMDRDDFRIVARFAFPERQEWSDDRDAEHWRN